MLNPATRKLVSVIFDAPFYLRRYRDVAECGVDPMTHYLEIGWREGRDPSPKFSTNGYLQANADVVSAGVCPLVHYVTSGILDGRTAPIAKRSGNPDGSPTIVESAVPLAERMNALPHVAAVEPLDGAALGRLIARLADERPVGIAVSISHDDYLTMLGGVQNCIRDEARALREKGWAYLHLCPVQPLPVLAEPTPPESFLVWLRANQERVGAVSVRVLIEAIGHCPLGEARRALILHHLMGFCPESVTDIARAFAPRETIVWVHDFFSLCPNYALLHNDVAFCGAPGPDSHACGTCVYGGDERRRHLARLERLATELNPIVFAPSDTALEFWRAHSRLTHASARTLPHGVLAMDRDLRPPAVASETLLRVGFVGVPAYHKGWHVFERLARLHERDPRYRFFHLGTVAGPEHSNIAFVEIAVDAERPDYMIDAIVTNGIDVVVNWSLCYETFSFSTHEAIAGGSFVLAQNGAGNIVPAITGAQQGTGLDSEQELFELFASGKIFELMRGRRYGELIRHPATAAYLEPQ